VNLNMGSHSFRNVEIPILWGKRAILQDKKGRISIISLEGEKAELEILGNKPAPKIEYELVSNGFKIMRFGKDVYSFNPNSRTITGLSLMLPEIEIGRDGIRIGSNMLSGGMVSGFGVGIVVDEHGIAMGAPLPEGLARLVV